MSSSRVQLSAAVLLAASLCIGSAIRAEVGDPTLRTDHPQYAGEGAFQTVEDCVAFAARNGKSPQDKALAMYLWLLTHQWHLLSPQEPCVPGQPPDTKQAENYELMVFDANRARFSYGYGLCGTVHAWNEPYWRALGMNSRRRAFPGHTNSEIEYSGSWHAFDTDMAGLVFRRDGVVAGYEDIVRDPALIVNAKPPLPCYPFDWPNDFRTMQRGWQEVAKGAAWYKMYNSGYAAHPGIIHLRSGETFTRYFDRDHFGGPTKRRFWHDEPGGPVRNWSFANNGVPEHRSDQANCRTMVSYSNGEFVYRPDLTQDRFRMGVSQASPNVSSATNSPRLRSGDRAEATCEFSHFSPYVICGDPADDANPMTGHATDGCTITGRAVGNVRCSLSVDQGQTWQSVGEFTGDFQHDATDLVKGHYGWHVRFQWSGVSGLDDLKFNTVTQVCQTIYPRLKPGGSHVVYRCGSRAVVPLLPNFGLPEDALAGREELPLRSANVKYSPRSRQSRFAYMTTDNKPGQIAFRVSAPRDLVEISAAARFGIRVPPPENCDFHLELSTNEGQSWSPLGRAEIPSDNEYSSGWMYGHRAVTASGARAALVRVHLNAGGYSTGLIDAQMYGVYRTSAPQPLTITYAWKENGKVKTHQESVPSGAIEHEFVVPTGAEIVDEFVRFEAM